MLFLLSSPHLVADAVANHVWQQRPATVFGETDAVQIRCSSLLKISRRFELTFTVNTSQIKFRSYDCGRGRSVSYMLCFAAFVCMSVPAFGQSRAAIEAARRIRAQRAAAAEKKDQASQEELVEEKLLPFLKKYCNDCHGEDVQEAGIRVDELKSADEFLSGRRNWERIYRMINSSIMPPGDYDPLPSAEERKAATDFLHDQLFNFDCELVDNPGRSTVQRLNRSEYNNTVRDLFGIDIRPADNFPADDVGEGFDNIGDVLSLPPLLLEKYLDAAEQVADAVLAKDGVGRPRTKLFAGDELKSSRGSTGVSNGFRVLPSNGDLYADFEAPFAGEYRLKIVAAADQAGDERAKFQVVINDKKISEHSVREHREPEEFEETIRLKDGKNRIAARFINDYYNPGAEGRKDRNFGVSEFALYGPIAAGGAGSSGSRKFLTDQPGKGRTARQAAANVLRPVMKRAFRRAVTEAEVDRYATLVEQAMTDDPDSWGEAVSVGLQAILIAPDFLFRPEKEAPAGQEERQLDDYEVATRLSYFLWSSTPDDELLKLADERRLRTPSALRGQIRRMLKDERADALVENFAGQWLNLRNLNEVNPSRKKFKAFNDQLRQDMRRETELLFASVMREDRSIEELISADYTFVNKRLAEFYDIKGVDDEKFERVSLKGTHRAGVLTHASILTLTSNPQRTSPVKRGKWILENIFGEAPPPPPADVPELEETAKINPKASVREQMEQHRADPGCAACHQLMDPLGLALENFDAVGRWRDRDEGRIIDASGTLPSGEEFSGPEELVSILKDRREKFFRTFTEKMLVYAIGRGTEYYDKCTVDEALSELKRKGYRFSAVVEAIVLSDPFLKRRAANTEVSLQ